MQKTDEAYEKSIVFYNCVACVDQLWFITLERNFMTMDKTTGQMVYVDCKEYEELEKYGVVDKMLTYCTSIYWVDKEREYIHEYNWRSKKYYRYSMVKIEGIDFQHVYVAGIYIHESVLWIFLGNIPYVIGFDLIHKNWVYSELFSGWINDRDMQGNILLWCSEQVQDNIYLFQNCGKVVKFNLNTSAYKCIEFSEELSEIKNVVWKNDIFYMLSFMGCVYIWDEKTGKTEKIYSCPNTEIPFSIMAVTEHKIFLLPRGIEKIVIVDLGNYNSVKQAEYPDDLHYSNCPDAKYGLCTEDEHYIWFDNRRANYILRINKKDEKIEWIKPKFPPIQEEWIHCQKDTLFLHEMMGGLKSFVEMKRYKVCGNKKAEMQKNVGKSIWNALKEN